MEAFLIISRPCPISVLADQAGGTLDARVCSMSETTDTT